MKKKMPYRIQSLLSQKGDTISGAMSPMCFAKEMAAHISIKFNRLARVWFDDQRTFQRKEDGGLTGFDTLLIARKSAGDLWLSLWVDEGVCGVPVAMAFQGEAPQLAPAYGEARYARKLKDTEINTLFKYVQDNPHLIDIMQH